MYKTCCFIILILLFTSGHCFAQDRAYVHIPAPSVLLVKLPTYAHKATIYHNAHNDKYEKQSIADATNMQREIVVDFNAHFKHCPYYFFYDTCSDLITAGKFDTILYDSLLHRVNEKIIAPGDTSYQIAYFGHYINTTDTKGNTNKFADSHSGSNYETAKIQRLVVVDHLFNNIPNPAPNGTDMNFGSIFNKYPAKRVYKSKLFDVYYIRYAALLSERMDKYYGK